MSDDNTKSFKDFIDRNLGQIIYIDVAIEPLGDDSNSIKINDDDSFDNGRGYHSILIDRDSDYHFRGEHHNFYYQRTMHYVEGYFLVPSRGGFGQGVFDIVLTSISREKVLLK